MKLFNTVIASMSIAALFFLGTINKSEASGRGGRVTCNNVQVYRGGVNSYGIQCHISQVGCYGSNYCGWTSRCWFPQYGCGGYFNPLDSQWYYWCATYNRYLPVSFMTQYPPIINGVPPVGINPGVPALPPGAVPVPNGMPQGTPVPVPQNNPVPAPQNNPVPAPQNNPTPAPQNPGPTDPVPPPQ